MNNLFKITEDNLKNFLLFTESTKSKNNKNSKKIILDEPFKNNNLIKNKISNGLYEREITREKNNIINIEKNNEKKSIYELGKSNIPTDILKKSMGKNLSVLENIYDLFIRFIDYIPGIKLDKIFQTYKNINKYNKLIPLYSSSNGSIYLIENFIYANFENIGKYSGTYKFMDCGYMKINDIGITDELLKKNKIPNLNSILSHKDNSKHFEKTFSIFSIWTDIFKNSESNFMGKTNINELHELFEQFYPYVIKGIDDKKKMFDIKDKNFTFYIKFYNDKAKAFILNKKLNLIYYLCTKNNLNQYDITHTHIFYFVFELDSKFRITKTSIEELSKTLDQRIFCNEGSSVSIDISSDEELDVFSLNSNDKLYSSNK